MRLISSLFEFIKTVAIIVIVAFIVRFYLIQPFLVEGSSMEPNFHNGEYILIDKLSYRVQAPKRGDVIVFHPPNNANLNYIKRIIGLPGDRIEIINGKVSVNGAVIEEAYIPNAITSYRSSTTAKLDVTLSAGNYYVLGDNRDHSSDSREWNAVPAINIIGRAWLVVFPPKNFGFVLHPGYVIGPELTHAVD